MRKTTSSTTIKWMFGMLATTLAMSTWIGECRAEDDSPLSPVMTTSQDEWDLHTMSEEGDDETGMDVSACRCWSLGVTDRLHKDDPAASSHGRQQVPVETSTECKCSGQRVLSVPNNLPQDVHHITLYSCGLETLMKGELQKYADTLADFVLDKANRLTTIEDGAFNGLDRLQRIYIRRAPLLASLPDGLFSLYLPSLHILLIKQTGLRVFPNLVGLETRDILHTVDLEENQLETIPSNSVRLSADDFLVNGNALRSIEAFAFNGSQIATLNLKGNRQLSFIHPDAFAGLTSLRRLDASQTAITSLPVRGLSELEILRLTETRSLKEIPSVYNYQWLREAYLTYPYHCCAFAFPATHDPQEHARHQQTLAEMQAKYCNSNSSDSAVLMPADLAYADSSGHQDEVFIDLSVQGGYSMEDPSLSEGGIFHPSPYQPPSNGQLFFHAFCGNLTAQTHREVYCTPQPDAFNPCEDILGATWLRVAAWLVSVASVVGNLAVVIVLIQTSRCPMAVSKFLMVNLALADLSMGLYLFLIVGMDVNTIGVYFNYAIDWQNGLGCQVAGFLTVFATELSVFTLVVITSERWYTITYAINLSRRLRLSTTAKIVAVGWIGSLTMASLPLAGVSSFSTTSICLPLENHSISDTIYLLVLLIVNGLAFLFICLCYGLMYRSISGQHRDTLASHSDATVAKRMALLVFTNLACWTPIAFFGLTAVAGHPLISVTHTKILLVFFYPLNACTNPYLYALVTKQYRRDFFQLLARYGLCKERANRYRTTISFGRSNNPVRASSQLEMAMSAKKDGHLERSRSLNQRGGSTPISQKRASPSHSRSGSVRKMRREMTQSEMGGCPAADARDATPTVEPTASSLEADLAVYHHQTNGSSAASPSIPIRSANGRLNSLDSPHPVKHRQVRLNGKDRRMVEQNFHSEGYQL